jgi:hypothetical protein
VAPTSSTKVQKTEDSRPDDQDADELGNLFIFNSYIAHPNLKSNSFCHCEARPAVVSDGQACLHVYRHPIIDQG